MFLSLPLVKTKYKSQVFTKLVVWQRKNIFFLFRESHALLQGHDEFKRFLKRNFITCYSCSYYSFILLILKNSSFSFYPIIVVKKYDWAIHIIFKGRSRFSIFNPMSDSKIMNSTINNSNIFKNIFNNTPPC